MILIGSEFILNKNISGIYNNLAPVGFGHKSLVKSVNTPKQGLITTLLQVNSVIYNCSIGSNNYIYIYIYIYILVHAEQPPPAGSAVCFMYGFYYHFDSLRFDRTRNLNDSSAAHVVTN